MYGGVIHGVLVLCATGNSEFCFPSTSMFPSASPRGTLRVLGKQNSLFPLGPVIKCLMTLVFKKSCVREFSAVYGQFRGQ